MAKQLQSGDGTMKDLRAGSQDNVGGAAAQHHFGPTSVPLRSTSVQFRSHFGPTSVHFGPVSVPLRSHFGPTSFPLRFSFNFLSVPFRSHAVFFWNLGPLSFFQLNNFGPRLGHALDPTSVPCLSSVALLVPASALLGLVDCSRLTRQPHASS